MLSALLWTQEIVALFLGSVHRHHAEGSGCALKCFITHSLL